MKLNKIKSTLVCGAILMGISTGAFAAETQQNNIGTGNEKGFAFNHGNINKALEEAAKVAPTDKDGKEIKVYGTITLEGKSVEEIKKELGITDANIKTMDDIKKMLTEVAAVK